MHPDGYISKMVSNLYPDHYFAVEYENSVLDRKTGDVIVPGSYHIAVTNKTTAATPPRDGNYSSAAIAALMIAPGTIGEDGWETNMTSHLYPNHVFEVKYNSLVMDADYDRVIKPSSYDLRSHLRK